MIGDFKRFNTKLPPLRQQHYLRPLTWVLSARLNLDTIENEIISKEDYENEYETINESLCMK